MEQKKNKIKRFNPKWIIKTRKYFIEFLKETGFPEPTRNGKRGSNFNYPEWLIMLISVVSVKMKLKNYLAIHRMTDEYWKELCGELDLKPISERQLRDRLKKIGHTARRAPGFIFQIFPESYLN